MGFLPIVAAGLSVLGAGASALAEHNTAVFKARVAQQQGQMASDQASVRATEVARDTTQRLAATRAGAAQNGFELTGSMADLLAQTERQGTLDYLTAVYDGSVQREGADATAANYRNEGTSALVKGAFGAASAALGGVSSAYRKNAAAINVSGT